MLIYRNRAFSINDEGDIIFSDPTALNSTVVHLTVLARDSGIPPRQVKTDKKKRNGNVNHIALVGQASVPVKINLPVDFFMVNGSGITLSPADGSGLLLIILGILLGILSLIISGLAVYLCQ